MWCDRNQENVWKELNDEQQAKVRQQAHDVKENKKQQQHLNYKNDSKSLIQKWEKRKKSTRLQNLSRLLRE